MNKRMLWLALAFSWGSVVAAEPRNLTLLKEEIVAYVDAGSYDEGLGVVAREAEAWVEQRAKQGGKLAMVFDIDETMISNVPHMRAQDFGYQSPVWDAWVARGEGPVIKPVREVYRVARKLGVAVIFITGRREKDRAGTEKNLKLAEVADYAALVMRSEDATGSTEVFKTAARRKLTTDGFVIIANIGDQESDLSGGFSERTFKLPNPFYQIK